METRNIILNWICLAVIVAMVLAVACSCSPRTAITVAQPGVVERVDTVGKHIRIKVRPAGPAHSALGHKVQAGDTIVMLQPSYTRKGK